MQNLAKSKTMSLSQEKSAIKHPHVLGLGEVFHGLKLLCENQKQ